MTDIKPPSPQGPPRFRLLIVEDDDLIAGLLGEALKAHFEVCCVPTGAGACSVLRAGGTEAVLLDDQVPDGPAALVLGEADRLGVPTLVMTGDPNALQGTAPREWSLLVKPFGTVELLLALERVREAAGGFARCDRPCHPGLLRPGLRFVIGREAHDGCGR